MLDGSIKNPLRNKAVLCRSGKKFDNHKTENGLFSHFYAFIMLQKVKNMHIVCLCSSGDFLRSQEEPRT